MEDKEKERRTMDYYQLLERNGGCGPLLLCVLLIVMLCVAGCRSTQYISVPEYHETHDTLIQKEVIEKEVIKEVTVKDSVSFTVKGDTVRIERWHYERDYSKEKALEAKVDSLTKARRDSIPYPVPGPKEYVERPLKGWQKALIWWGVFCTLALIVFIIIRVRFPKARCS